MPDIELTLPGDDTERLLLVCHNPADRELFCEWLQALADDPGLLAEFCETLRDGLEQAEAERKLGLH